MVFFGEKRKFIPQYDGPNRKTARLWTDKSPHMTELKSAGVCVGARARVLGVQTIVRHALGFKMDNTT